MDSNQFGGRENLEAIEFLRQFNYIAHTEFPGVVTIARNPPPGRR